MSCFQFVSGAYFGVILDYRVSRQGLNKVFGTIRSKFRERQGNITEKTLQ